MSIAEKKYRVAQWATGNVGAHSLRMVLEHPRMTLAGLYVHSDAKAGRDAGTFCGKAATGIRATRSLDDIVAAKPDCVLYMPARCNFDEICRLLESGINVVTTRHEVSNPSWMESAARERVEAACRRGGTSIHATGSSPGFVSEALPIVLASMQRRLDLLQINEYADMASRNSPDMMFNLIGFGRAPMPAANEARAKYQRESFGPTLGVTANALGLTFDSVEAHGESALARHDTHIAAGVIKAGTVAAQRTVITAMRRGKVLMRMTTTWHCTTDVDQDWDLRGDGWHIVVQGDAPFEVTLRFTTPPDKKAAVTPGYTANRAVNAVPFICDAPPGIRTTADLPQIIADLRD